MLLSSEALGALIERSASGMTLKAFTAATNAAYEVRSKGVTARSDSAESLFMQSILNSHRELLTDEAVQRFADVEILGVDSPYINAFAIQDEQGRDCILLFQGLYHLVHYFADLITVLNLLQEKRPQATISDGEGGVHSEAQLFSMAGFAILSECLATAQYPPYLHEMLGEQHRQNVKEGTATAFVFVMLHELAHHHLGHVYLDNPRSEAPTLALLEPEHLSDEQQDEFDADSQALQWIADVYRGPIQSSLLFLLGAHAFIEAFSGSSSQNHPLAINRLFRLSKAAKLSDEERKIVDGWIEDRAKNFRAMARERAAEGGSIRKKIERAMSIKHAWAIIAEVKQRVITENGFLS